MFYCISVPCHTVSSELILGDQSTFVLCVSVPPLSLHEQGILHYLSATIYVQQEAVLNIDFCCSPVLILSLSSRGCLCVCSCLRAVKR